MDSAQNPFVRLKRYQVAGNNPEENHATEVLAACLDLSLEFRRAFLILLHEQVSSLFDAENWKVRTQVHIPSGSDEAGRSFWDLLLENQEAGRAVVIEVKVRARLTQSQIDKYLSDLGGGSATMQGTVFTLLRDKSLARVPWDNVITWKEVAGLCRQIDPGSLSLVKSTDGRIAARLADYLEHEKINVNYHSKDMLGLAAGVQAERAFDALSEECQRRATKALALAESRFRQPRRTGSFPRLNYRSHLFYADLHLRAPGLEGWTAGHTLALGIGVLEPSTNARELAVEFRLKGWQAWVHLVTRSWKPMGNTEEIPADIFESYAYKPLFSEGDPQKGHMPAPDWGLMTWEELVSAVSCAFIDTITQIQDFEKKLGRQALSPTQPPSQRIRQGEGPQQPAGQDPASNPLAP